MAIPFDRLFAPRGNLSRGLAQAFTTLVNFNGANGATPQSAGIIRDSAANVYGTIGAGGPGGVGVVYKLDTAGHVTVLGASPLQV